MSSIFFNVSWGIPSNSGTCCVKHNSGAVAQSNESSKTDKDPDTAIWPIKINYEATMYNYVVEGV